MIPQLTETWGASYFQVLVVLLIFALGLPALLFQISVPEEVKYTLYRWKKSHVVALIIYVTVVLICALCFIWFLHPCSNDQDSVNKNFISAMILSLVLFMTLIYWVLYIIKGVKKLTIKILITGLKKGYNKNGILSEDQIDLLVILGEKSESGFDKQIILASIYNLINHLLQTKLYKGSNFEILLLEIDKICTCSEKRGNETNYFQLIIIIELILDYFNKNDLLLTSDSDLAYEALSKLGISALVNNYDSVVFKILDISYSNSEILLRIGLSAIYNWKYVIAVKALNKLEALNTKTNKIKPTEDSANLFGLLSYFWKDDTSKRIRAMKFFESDIEFEPSLERCLDYAFDYHFAMANYDTADMIKAMHEDLKKNYKKIYKR